MDDHNRCGGCGQERPADAPAGLCPICLLRAGQIGDDALSDQDCDAGSVAVDPKSLSMLATLERPFDQAAHGQARGTELGDRLAVRAGRLQLLGPIGRGGMGIVLKGRDRDLGRDLAVKVLLEQYCDHPAMIRRFIAEAQIGGQLQHPGVVPVYELGLLPDHRPYFAMKLIKGRTLAQLLAGRSEAEDDRPRLLGIFEAVCQTMAYAHARGVIHRDLKPSNIMVGSFGEVQVMDWGVAKVLGRRGDQDDVAVSSGVVQETIISTGRRDAGIEGSRPGSVIGTPAYMAPEQARGEVDEVDERADVFALGSILCEMLVGRPAFTGPTSGEIERQAACGAVGLAHALLDACGADAPLVALARDCLAAEPAERPRDARAVAQRVTAYRAGAQEKLRAAELAAVEAHARADEEMKRRGLADQLADEALARAALERRRRRLTLALAGSILAIVISGGGVAAWFVQERQAGLERANVALREVELLGEQAKRDPDGDLGKWQAAQAAIRHTRTLWDAVPAGTGRSRLEKLARKIEQGEAQAAVDRTLVARLEVIRAGLDADAKADLAYALAFREAGLDLLATTADPAVIGQRIAARPRAVAQAAALALDAWAVVRGSRIHPGDDRAEAEFRRLLTAARAADPDPWRAALRDAFERRNLEGYRRLAQDINLARQGPVSLWLLGFVLELLGDHDRALEILRRGQRTYPGDYWLNIELGLALLEGKRSGPGTTRSVVTASLGDHETKHQAAEPFFMAAVALRPQSGGPHHLLGVTYQRQGKLSDAIAELHEAIRLQPDDATIRNSLANAYVSAGKLDAAIDQYRAAIRLAPTYNLPLLNLADILLTRQGEIDQAIAVYRQAIQLDAAYDMAHVHLGFALENRGWADEAVAEYREAIRLNPKCFLAHANLGDALCRRGDFALAVVEFRSALDLTTISQRRESLKQQIARTERYKALALRLPAILRGAEEPSDPAQRLEFAQICHYLRRYAAATRLFTEALAADPKLGDDMTNGTRYSAACSAALAAAGQSKDEPPLDDAAKTLMRRRAYEWLKADHRALSTIASEGRPQYRAQVQQFFQHWTVDPNLAGIRDPSALSRLPEPERKDWRSLWSAVGDLLGQPRPAHGLQ